MKNKPTVTIGIPAFNEEANIRFLLEDLAKQKAAFYDLKSIVVVSDGSSDKTVQLVKDFRISNLKLVVNKKRQGIANVQNQILKLASTDILVLVQADVSVYDRNFIDKLIVPIINDSADLVAAKIEELTPTSMIEKVVFQSMKFKKSVYERYNWGNNIYTCYGPARAFSKKFYKKIHFSNSIGEDAYSYLYAISNGFKYQYSSRAIVKYKLPDTLSDHTKQSLRFTKSRKLLEKEFGETIISKEYSLPKGILISEMIKYFCKTPIMFTTYMMMSALISLKSIIRNESSDVWIIAKSSKDLRKAI